MFHSFVQQINPQNSGLQFHLPSCQRQLFSLIIVSPILDLFKSSDAGGPRGRVIMVANLETWDKPSSACGWSGGCSRGSPVFAPPYVWLLRMSEIILTGCKTQIKKKIWCCRMWHLTSVCTVCIQCCEFVKHKWQMSRVMRKRVYATCEQRRRSACASARLCSLQRQYNASSFYQAST